MHSLAVSPPHEWPQSPMREVSTRPPKGLGVFSAKSFTKKRRSVTRTGNELNILADDRFKLRSVLEILNQRLAKRGVPLKALKFGEPRDSSQGTVNQGVTLQEGISSDQAREMVKIIKGLKSKAQPTIMGDQLRVKAKSRDDLQTIIAQLREQDLDFDIQFTNYRS